ncbi:hypothetical protein F4556_001062 [Kitasatospora gansuensis]|uniref:Uncharacterized protein n=1 Tax=Kitasatospora gansuensis TaxID=258050 RepID=A0A7W7S8B4_9ACTN|nr:hypothetical protein [Kitasatospora gansuensis]MBB4945527.1 hypothetical protein [Kitasatospora gansuensis]
MDRKILTTAAVFVAATVTALAATLSVGSAAAGSVADGGTQTPAVTSQPSPSPTAADLGWG